MGKKTEEKSKKNMLKLDGDLSIYDVASLRERLVSSLRDADTLEVDMTDVRDCDISAIQILCSGKKTADEQGRQILLTGVSKTFEAAMIKTGVTYKMISHNGGEECQGQ